MHKQDTTRRRLVAGAQNRDKEKVLIPRFPPDASLPVPDIYVHRYTEGQQAGCMRLRLNSDNGGVLPTFNVDSEPVVHEACFLERVHLTSRWRMCEISAVRHYWLNSNRSRNLQSVTVMLTSTYLFIYLVLIYSVWSHYESCLEPPLMKTDVNWTGAQKDMEAGRKSRKLWLSHFIPGGFIY